MEAHLQLRGDPPRPRPLHTRVLPGPLTYTRPRAPHGDTRERRARSLTTRTTPSPQEFTHFPPTGSSQAQQPPVSDCTRLHTPEKTPSSACLSLSRTHLLPRSSHTNGTLDSGPHSLSVVGLPSDLRLSLGPNPQPSPPGLPTSCFQVCLALCFPLLTPGASVQAGATGCVQRKQEPKQAPQIKRPGGVSPGWCPGVGGPQRRRRKG